jgi:hypothetical protein
MTGEPGLVATSEIAAAADAVAIRTLQQPVDESGHETDALRGAGLYVIVYRAAGWKIVAGQITFVVDPAWSHPRPTADIRCGV